MLTSMLPLCQDPFAIPIARMLELLAEMLELLAVLSNYKFLERFTFPIQQCPPIAYQLHLVSPFIVVSGSKFFL